MRALLLLLILAVPAPAAAETAPAPADSTPRILEVENLHGLGREVRDALYTGAMRATRAALEAKHFDTAQVLATKSTLLFPERRRPWLHLAAARFRLEKWGPAIEAARQAATARADDLPPPTIPEEGPGGPGYWEGVALYRTQRTADALVRLRAARTAAPDWAEAARALGEAAFVAKRMPEAAQAYDDAVRLGADVMTTRDLGYCAEARAATGDLNGGIAALQEALQRSRFEPGLHGKMGDLLRREGNFAEAYYHFLLELVLHGLEGPFAKPALRLSQETVRNAIADSLHPARDELRAVSAGFTALQAKRYRVAVHDIGHAVRVTGTATQLPWFLLADAYAQSGDTLRALSELDRILVRDPDFVPALESRAALRGGEAAARDRDRIRALFPKYWKLLQSEDAAR
jgi:tetratricopeptide (TPR) repeat protein